MPDRSTRYLVSTMSRLGIDCFCLIDGDPCGFDIFLTYRIGSWQMVHESSLVAERLRLVGVRPSQFGPLGLTSESLQPLSKSDFSRLGSMKCKIIAKLSNSAGDDTLKPISAGDDHESGYDTQSQNNADMVDLLHELELFDQLQTKAEIESLEGVNGGILRGDYLTNYFLRDQIEHQMEIKYNYQSTLSQPLFSNSLMDTD